ncbi:hypothetical protein PPERSA_08526 [Pseudocohnilembus persalinus]|uniref:BUB1 N-terminal domain-containing protein n=1 Tax=Pseudocohnilembus persalinus TaxID=266149 RepID=A0A0V0R6M9_PSEPJ|nr:hypothetical protein PPERSA_08526 [Pseudocohnilembus persalinus]|eukprot:KRX10123.1 hypothetical protein PPERSA_08526 [Pseudocohnilembus persalinus]
MQNNNNQLGNSENLLNSIRFSEISPSSINIFEKQCAQTDTKFQSLSLNSEKYNYRKTDQPNLQNNKICNFIKKNNQKDKVNDFSQTFEGQQQESIEKQSQIEINQAKEKYQKFSFKVYGPNSYRYFRSIEKCIEYFSDNLKNCPYKKNSSFVRMMIKFAFMTPDTEQILLFLLAQGIGTHDLVLYSAILKYYEQQREFRKAQKIVENMNKNMMEICSQEFHKFQQNFTSRLKMYILTDFNEKQPIIQNSDELNKYIENNPYHEFSPKFIDPLTRKTINYYKENDKQNSKKIIKYKSKVLEAFGLIQKQYQEDSQQLNNDEEIEEFDIDFENEYLEKQKQDFFQNGDFYNLNEKSKKIKEDDDIYSPIKLKLRFDPLYLPEETPEKAENDIWVMEENRKNLHNQIPYLVDKYYSLCQRYGYNEKENPVYFQSEMKNKQQQEIKEKTLFYDFMLKNLNNLDDFSIDNQKSQQLTTNELYQKDKCEHIDNLLNEKTQTATNLVNKYNDDIFQNQETRNFQPYMSQNNINNNCKNNNEEDEDISKHGHNISLKNIIKTNQIELNNKNTNSQINESNQSTLNFQNIQNKNMYQFKRNQTEQKNIVNSEQKIAFSVKKINNNIQNMIQFTKQGNKQLQQIGEQYQNALKGLQDELTILEKKNNSLFNNQQTSQQEKCQKYFQKVQNLIQVELEKQQDLEDFERKKSMIKNQKNTSPNNKQYNLFQQENLNPTKKNILFDLSVSQKKVNKNQENFNLFNNNINNGVNKNKNYLNSSNFKSPVQLLQKQESKNSVEDFGILFTNKTLNYDIENEKKADNQLIQDNNRNQVQKIDQFQNKVDSQGSFVIKTNSTPNSLQQKLSHENNNNIYKVQQQYNPSEKIELNSVTLIKQNSDFFTPQQNLYQQQIFQTPQQNPYKNNQEVGQQHLSNNNFGEQSYSQNNQQLQQQQQNTSSDSFLYNENLSPFRNNQVQNYHVNLFQHSQNQEINYLDQSQNNIQSNQNFEQQANFYTSVQFINQEDLSRNLNFQKKHKNNKKFKKKKAEIQKLRNNKEIQEQNSQSEYQIQYSQPIVQNQDSNQNFQYLNSLQNSNRKSNFFDKNEDFSLSFSSLQKVKQKQNHKPKSTIFKEFYEEKSDEQLKDKREDEQQNFNVNKFQNSILKSECEDNDISNIQSDEKDDQNQQQQVYKFVPQIGLSQNPEYNQENIPPSPEFTLQNNSLIQDNYSDTQNSDNEFENNEQNNSSNQNNNINQEISNDFSFEIFRQEQNNQQQYQQEENIIFQQYDMQLVNQQIAQKQKAQQRKPLQPLVVMKPVEAQRNLTIQNQNQSQSQYQNQNQGQSQSQNQNQNQNNISTNSSDINRQIQIPILNTDFEITNNSNKDYIVQSNNENQNNSQNQMQIHSQSTSENDFQDKISDENQQINNKINDIDNSEETKNQEENQVNQNLNQNFLSTNQFSQKVPSLSPITEIYSSANSNYLSPNFNNLNKNLNQKQNKVQGLQLTQFKNLNKKINHQNNSEEKKLAAQFYSNSQNANVNEKNQQ